MTSAKLSIFITPLLVLLVFSTVFGQKKKKSGEVGAIPQAYHNTTARYNIYFNADLKMKEVKEGIESSYKENYKKILPVYKDRDLETSKNFAADLDIIIKKCSKIATYHEPARFNDDSYLLLGQSYFLKGELGTALETFRYINTELKVADKKDSKKKKKKSKKKKSKKKRSKSPMSAQQLKEAEVEEAKEEIQEDKEKEGKTPFFSFLKHQPSSPKSVIWIADTYTAMKQYRDAEAVLTIIDGTEDFPTYLARDVEVARVNLYLQKNEPNNAIEPLSKLTDKLYKRKKKKTRFYYILAQIYEQQADYATAIENYKLVLKSRPKYEMEFNAKMSIARLSTQTSLLSYNEVKKLLNKMIRDDKNLDYFDQIYYYLGELSLQHNARQEAIEYYKKSVSSSTSNTEQKALSYLKLGQLNFEDENYVVAQAYYDSTLTVLDKENEQYAVVDERNLMLKELVKQMNIIEEQDSLQRIAAMPERDRRRFLEDLIRKQEEEKEKQQRERNQPNNNFQSNNTLQSQGSGAGGTWYFYNQGTKGVGFNDFVKKWGNRKNEDNWRRKDKSAFFEDEEKLAEFNDNDGQVEETAEAGNDVEGLMAGLPITEEAKAASDAKIIQAYFELAYIYKSQLKNNAKSIAAFEELLKRYPDNKYAAETHYNLYLLYGQMGKDAKVEEHKDIILTKHPDSKFAKIIKDPNYLQESKKDNDALLAYYEETFNYYKINQMPLVMARADQADSLFDNNYMKPQFALLRAYAVGATDSLQSYVEALQDIVKTYPDNEVKDKAEEMLSYLKKSDNKDYERKINIVTYDYNVASTHYFMIVYTDKKIQSSGIIQALAEYNDVNQSLTNLKVNALPLNDLHTLILVKDFPNLKKAQGYYDAVKASEDVQKKLPAEGLNYFIISDVNFNKIIINKEVASYFDFFSQKYSR